MDLAALVSVLTPTGLIAIMLSMGLKVRFADVLASARRLRLVVLGLLANFVLVPVLTVALLYLFQANPMVSAGFLILAVCPGAPVGPPFVAAAKGDVPLAIGQMVILSVLSAILSPALLSLLLIELSPESPLRIDYVSIVKVLFSAQLLPLAVGLAIQHGAPNLTARIAKPLGLLANSLLLGVVALVLAREFNTLALIRWRGWIGMALLLSGSLGIGWLCGGPALATRKTGAVTTVSRNAAVGLVIVSSNFARTPAVTAVVAYALVSILATLGCAFLLARLPEATRIR